MPSESPESAQVHKTAVLKEQVCDAGQFEHVAHMSVFEDQLLPVKIPVKLFYTKNISEDTTCSGPADAEKRDRNKSADADKRTSDCSRLLDVVRADLAWSESEDISEDEEEDINTARSCNERGHFGATPTTRGKRFTKQRKTSEAAQFTDGFEWQRAKEKIEEFLDFPAIASGLAFRTLKELQSYSNREESENTEKRTLPCKPMTLQNSRPTAVFLRESQRSLQHLTSQEPAFLENFSIINSSNIGSHQRENVRPVFQPPVETCQQTNFHDLPDTKRHLNETQSHRPQSVQVSIPNNDQNGVILEKIQKSLELLIEQKKPVLDPNRRVKSPEFEQDNEALNIESPGEEGPTMSASYRSQDEPMEQDGRQTPVHLPRTKLNVVPGSTSQGEL